MSASLAASAVLTYVVFDMYQICVDSVLIQLWPLFNRFQKLMSNESQSGSIAIWVAVITVIGGIAVAFINSSSSPAGNSSDTPSNTSVCDGAEFSVQGDNSNINCSN